MRFFLETLSTGQDDMRLEGEEAHHLMHVLRAKPGARVWLFDGQGRECEAEVVELHRTHVRLRGVQARVAVPPLGPRLTLAVALPKGERQAWLVEKSTELGVQQVIPLITQRGVAQPTPAAMQRLRRAVIQACKQCERCHFLQLPAPRSVTELTLSRQDGIGLWGDPRSNGLVRDHLPLAPRDRSFPIQVAIGPEGGFTEDEQLLFQQAGWQAVRLGPHLMRIETAALAAASAIMSFY